jgi:MraZ protein
MPDEGLNSQKQLSSTQVDQDALSERRLGFIGVYNHSIDGKGRVIVPLPFRNLLGDRIVVGVNMAQDSIAIYPYDIWEEKVNMLTSLSREDVSAEVFLARFAMYSFDGLGYDSQGRVLLPAALRELFLTDAQGVQVSGTTEYVRIVSDAQAAREREEFNTLYPDPLKTISAIQARARSKSQGQG